METLFMNVDWLAVVVGAVAAFLVGWLWYSPKLFGNRWAAGVGMSLVEPKDVSLLPMLAQGISTFLLSLTVGVMMVDGDIALIVLMALAVAGLVKAKSLFLRHTTYAVAVDSIFILVMVAIMVATHLVLA